MLELNKLHLMDCMEGMKTFPDKYFDLCLTDPPYGVNLEYNTYNDTIENWFALMLDFVPEIKRISKMTIFPSCSINKMEWIYKNIPPDWLICWYKGSPGHSAYIGFNDFEPLLVYGKVADLHMHDYFTLTNTEKMGNHNHPCPKPVLWYKKLIKMIGSRKIGKMIEPFAGSGSGIIAAIDYGCEWIGFEIDEDYHKAASKRIEIHKKRPKPFFTDGELADKNIKQKGFFDK